MVMQRIPADFRLDRLWLTRFGILVGLEMEPIGRSWVGEAVTAAALVLLFVQSWRGSEASWDESSLERNVVLRGDCNWRDGRWTVALGSPNCGRIRFADHLGSAGLLGCPRVALPLLCCEGPVDNDPAAGAPLVQHYAPVGTAGGHPRPTGATRILTDVGPL
jgi:hypothetical protein